jgi:hypothetical protein
LRDAPAVLWTVIIVALLVTLIGRLAYVWIHYRRVKAAGHNVRWEWPLARWWRNVKARRADS